MASGGPPASSFPPSMGPGAHPISQGPDLQTTVQAIQDARSQYQVRVEPTELKISYSLNNENRGFTIPFDSIPLAGASKWLLYGGSGRAFVTGTFYLDMVRGAENMAGRYLTQREAEGFALHTGKRMKYALIGNLAAIGGGIGWSAVGYKSMKFPFRPVKPIEAYDVFPTERLTLFRGQFARAAWQITRVNIYIALATLFFNPFFRSLGDSIMTVGLYRDDRTKDIVKEVKGSFDRIRMNRPLTGQQPTRSSVPATQSMEDANAQDFYAKDSSSQSYYGKSTDYSSDNTFTDSATDTGVLSDSAMRRQESRQPAPNSFTTRTPQRQTESTGFFDDDASPTAGNDPDTSTLNRSQSQSSNSGSAWDRIRGSPSQSQTQSRSQSTYQTSTQPYPDPSAPYQPTNPTTRPMQETRFWRSSRQSGQSQSQDFETSADSFSFSSSDEQRALAKEQAQRDFDRMLERERKESGSGDYERESSATHVGGNEGGGNQDGQSAWGRRRRS